MSELAAASGLASLQQILALLLVGNLVVGLLRVLRGPTPFDRMMSAQFFGTVSVGFLLLVGASSGVRALRDVALLMAILAPVATIAFVRAREVRARRDP